MSAFAFLGGVPQSILYDNTKLAVARILGDGRRKRTRAFTELQSHYLLDVARIETGELAVSPEPTDVAALAGEARREFVSRGARHNVHIDLAPDLPWVMADRMRLIQVLGNLLTNAARHSPESSPIRVSARREGVHVAVAVSDESRGIPAESLPLLFRKFSRVDAEDQGGDTGLGLAICKGIVEVHGGRIQAERDGPGLWGRASPSRYRQWSRPGTSRRQRSPSPRPAPRGAGRRNRCAFWRWTTTPRPSGTSARSCPGRYSNRQ